MDIEEIKEGIREMYDPEGMFSPSPDVPPLRLQNEALLWIIEKLQETPTIQVAHLEPGDVVVVTVPHRISNADHEAIMSRMKAFLPAGHQILVMDDGSQLAVVHGG